MLQRGSILQGRAVPAASSTAVELNEGWQNSIKDQWGDVLRGLLQLPTTPRGFFVYLVGLAIICGALTIYVLLSVQIMDAQLRISRMDDELARIEQTNSELIYQMAQKTSMAQMNQRAFDEGYVHNVQRLYVRPSAIAVGATTAAQLPASAGEPQALSPAISVDSAGDHSATARIEPAAVAREMSETVGAAVSEAVDFLTIQGGTAAESISDQGEIVTARMAPLGETINEFITTQRERIEQTFNP